MSAPTPVSRSGAATAALFALALVAGVAMPLQGRVNSALALHIGSAPLAAAASFAAGLAVMLVATLALPSGRRALARVLPALRSGRVRWWQLTAGVVGATLVFGQSATIPVLGVALFTVAVVTGQVVGGLTLDRLGWTPAGVQRISARRLLGAGLALAAVVTAAWPRLTAGDVPGAALLLALAPFVAGIAASGQQVMNGIQTSAYGSPLPATLFNFLAGTLALGVLAGLAAVTAPPAAPLPPIWWMYLGGPLGCCFVALASFLIPRMGALLTTLGLVAGQLLGSLGLDVVAPAPGTHVTALTVLGTLAALAAVGLGSTSGRLPVGLRRRHGR